MGRCSRVLSQVLLASVSEMTDSRPPPIPLSSRPVSNEFAQDSPRTVINSALSATSAALDTLKDVLEASDTLPCVQYVAGVVLKILHTIHVSDVRSFNTLVNL